MTNHDGKTELRFEVPIAEASVLDGYCNANGKSRTDVLRAILAEWSGQRVHESTVICRVAGINPFSPESDQRAAGRNN